VEHPVSGGCDRVKQAIRAADESPKDWKAPWTGKAGED